MSKKIIDISMEISDDMPVYKGRAGKKPQFNNISNYETGANYETEITINLHTGTHVDAPLHMVEDGKNSEIFDSFSTECQVLDLTNLDEKITADNLENFDINKNDFLIFKTKNSYNKGTKDFVYLDSKGADYLVKKSIKGVGIDSLGIERAQPGHPTHKKILKNNIYLIEGLELEGVEPGKYELLFLPLKIREVEAVPLKAILIDRN